MGNEDSASGTLYEVESGGQFRHLFISANRRMPVDSPNVLCNAQLLLNRAISESCEVECSHIFLTSDRVHNVWNTQPQGDHKGITIVELSNEVAVECQSLGAKFLRVGKAQPNEEVCL